MDLISPLLIVGVLLCATGSLMAAPVSVKSGNWEKLCDTIPPLRVPMQTMAVLVLSTLGLSGTIQIVAPIYDHAFPGLVLAIGVFALSLALLCRPDRHALVSMVCASGTFGEQLQARQPL